MRNKIQTPYTITNDERVIINANFTSHNDWDKKDVFDGIKSNIKDFLRTQQDNECCYCKRELGFDIKQVDIEHIIPKSLYCDFIFEPLNLALSCPACNTKKSHNDILSKKVTRYPKHSKNMLIIHAHYDNYNEHILIHDGCVFEAVSKKGSHTITVCELFRLKEVEKKAKEAMSKKSTESELVNSLINNATTNEEISNTIGELLRRIR